MKKVSKIRKKKANKKSFALVILFLLMISVGFAMLSASVSLNGTFNVKKTTFDVHFENDAKTANSTVDGTIEYKDNDTTLEFTTALVTPGDKYEFTADIVNKGTVDAMLNKLELSELTSDQAKYLAYTVTYADGSQIEKYDGLRPEESKKVLVTVDFLKDINNEDLPTEEKQITLTIGMEFVQADENAKLSVVIDQNKVAASYKYTTTSRSASLSHPDTTLTVYSENELNDAYIGKTEGIARIAIYNAKGKDITSTCTIVPDENEYNVFNTHVENGLVYIDDYVTGNDVVDRSNSFYYVATDEYDNVMNIELSIDFNVDYTLVDNYPDTFAQTREGTGDLVGSKLLANTVIHKIKVVSSHAYKGDYEPVEPEDAPNLMRYPSDYTIQSVSINGSSVDSSKFRIVNNNSPKEWLDVVNTEEMTITSGSSYEIYIEYMAPWGSESVPITGNF